VWRGAAEDDGFNRLVLVAGLEWRDVTVIRAYARYQRQTAAKFTQPYVEDSLAGNPHIAGLLIELFGRRFDPEFGDDAARRTAVEDTLGRLKVSLDAVMALDEDRILRSLLALVQATVRTNAYQRGADGKLKSYISLKLDSARSLTCRCRCPCSRSSSTRRGSRRSTCGGARSRAVASAGRTGARTSARRCSG
jgi:glutamate dehydrogenase